MTSQMALRTCSMWASTGALAAVLASVLPVPLGGCESGASDASQRYGGLLHARPAGAAEGSAEAVDVGRAARDVDELLRAVRVPHHRVGALLGPHVFHAHVSLAAGSDASPAPAEPRGAAGGSEAAGAEAGGSEAAGADNRPLEIDVRIEHAADDRFRALVENSEDYGREVVFADGHLYLRPRYSKFHRRLPEPADEPATIRDQVFGELAAQVELVQHGIEVHDLGAVTHQGRHARKIDLRKAARPSQPPAQPLAQRQWRESVTVDQIAGEIVLDQETGVPLAATLRASVTALREGQRVHMQIAVTHGIEGIGQAPAVTTPDETQWVPTPVRTHEMDERNALLEDIAQPARAAPTPANPSGAAQVPAAEDQ